MHAATGLLISLSALAAAAPSASAIIVNMTHSSTGSGTLNGVPFPSSAFTITATGETDNRTFNGVAWVQPHTTARISIQGLGDFDFLVPTTTFVASAGGFGSVGFGAPAFDLVDGPFSAAFGTYDFLTDVGPVTGTGQILQWSNGSINTTGGVLFLNNATPEVAYQADAVPAPMGTLPLAFGALVLCRRGRRARPCSV